MQNLLRLDYEKILLLSTTIFRGDYRINVSFRSRVPLHQPKIPTATLALPDKAKHESTRELLGQCANGAFFQKLEDGMGSNPRLSQPYRGETLNNRLCCWLLQPDQAAPAQQRIKSKRGRETTQN